LIKKEWKDAIIDRLSAGTGWTLALLILWLGFILHLWLAAYFPLSNDEAYYWDWGQQLQMSYYDHPPGIAWITALNAKWGGGLLAVRLLVPFLHTLAAFFLLLCFREVHPDWRPRDFMLLSAAAMLWPGFALLGVFALPDAGLYPFITAALWLTLRYRRRDQLDAQQGVHLGLVLGLAGLFKYHAIPIGLGLSLSLLGLRRREFRRELSFWGSMVTATVLMTTPVWVWNMQHDWVSIRYQAEHGLGDLQWNPISGLRTLLGFFIFLTPGFAWLLLRSLRRLAQDRWSLPGGVPLILLASSVPLILLVMGISFFKPVLMHWVMPGFWLLLPAAVALFADDLARSRRSWLLAALLSVILPCLLARKDFRRSLVLSLEENAGFIMELTLWPELNKGLQTVRQPILQVLPRHCPVDGYLAGSRWFTVAQLHFLNPRMPTISLDRRHPSYYAFRDQREEWIDCPVTLVIPAKDYRAELYQDLIATESVTAIPMKVHAWEKYLAVSGRLIAGPDKVLQTPAQASDLHAKRMK
jgi:4-amino-4-deoxy-L-arabinose transferase-like glycosyltransferase